MKIVHFDCFSGIAGDMTLAAMIDAGLPVNYLKEELSKLSLDDNFSLEVSKASRHGISGTKLDVKVTKAQHGHRHYSDICNIIESSGLKATVKELALKFFKTIGEAESKIHQVPLEKIHFHEVGAIDSIVDLVGTAIGIDYFSPDKITSSPVPVGTGEIRCDHGVMPNPAPATMEILKGIPINQLPINKELCTPTGAAIIRVLAEKFELSPNLKVTSTGYGIGTFELSERANVLRILIGEESDSPL